MKKIIFLSIILISYISCREEVIEPDNFVENVNEPVQINEQNSYTLLLYAQSLSMNISVPAYFNTTRTRFNISLFDYEAGFISITVEDYNEIERFRYYVAEEVSYHSDLLDGFLLKTINIRTENFSGKIKVEFRKTL